MEIQAVSKPIQLKKAVNLFIIALGIFLTDINRKGVILRIS